MLIKVNRRYYFFREKFVLLEFETAVAVVPNCIVIGSKLDTDINANLCRLAFNGRALKTFNNKVRYLICIKYEK